MKVYEYFYRKRGLPGSEEKNDILEAASFYDANAKAAKIVGEEFVVTKVKRKEEEYESIRISKEDI